MTSSLTPESGLEFLTIEGISIIMRLLAAAKASVLDPMPSP